MRASRRDVLKGSASYFVLSSTIGAPFALAPETLAATPTYADGFGPGIYFPDVVRVCRKDGYTREIASGFVRGLAGAVSWQLSGDIAKHASINATGVMSYPGGAYFPAGRYSGTVTASNDTLEYAQNVTLVNLDEPCVMLGRNVVFDTQTTAYPGAPANTRLIGSVASLSGPAMVENQHFAIDPPLDATTHLIATAALLPLHDHFGRYDVPLSSRGATTNLTTVWIAEEQPANFKFTPRALGIYDYLEPGDSIGRLDAYCDSGIKSIQPLNSDNGDIYVGLDGTFTVVAPLTPGDKSVTVRIISNNNKTTDAHVTYRVLKGNKLPASAMTLKVNERLDNYVFKQAVGTPSVTAITGTKSWTLSSPDDCVGIYNHAAPLNLFAIDARTGRISATQQLPARTIPITVTCCDGPNFCRQTFDIPVTWHQGPTLHVGRGCSARYGATLAHGVQGFEHLAEVMLIFNNNNNPDVGSTYAGAKVYIHADRDPDYYVNDNGGGSKSNWSLRFGIHGPVQFLNFDPAGPRPSLGGTPNQIGQGSGTNAKAFFAINSGDCIIDGLEVSWVNGSDSTHGLSGIRKDADTWGDIIIRNCDIHDCNNCIESGNGPYHTVVENSRLTNFGTEYVSSGATHGLYCGACTYVEFKNNLVFCGTNGHGLKTRAKSGLVENNRIYDGERGSLSNCIDMPECGRYVVTGNDLHKGTNTQNSYVIQYGEEAYTDPNSQLFRVNELTVTKNTISIVCAAGTHNGALSGVSATGAINAVTGAKTIVSLADNAFYLSDPSYQTRSVNPYGLGVPPASFTETGSRRLAAPPALDFSMPWSKGPAAGEPGPYLHVIDQTGSYKNFSDVQINPGRDDIRISATSPAGTTIGACVANGCILSKNTNDFGAGTKWSIVFTPQFYTQKTWGLFGASPWAPNGRYDISTNADGSGTLKVAGALPTAGTVDFIVLQAIGPGGRIAEHRTYIVLV